MVLFVSFCRYLNASQDWVFEENTNANPVQCFFIQRNGNAKSNDERKLLVKRLANAETLFKSDSPNISPKLLVKDNRKMSAVSLHKSNNNSVKSNSNNNQRNLENYLSDTTYDSELNGNSLKSEKNSPKPKTTFKSSGCPFGLDIEPAAK